MYFNLMWHVNRNKETGLKTSPRPLHLEINVSSFLTAAPVSPQPSGNVPRPPQVGKILGSQLPVCFQEKCTGLSPKGSDIQPGKSSQKQTNAHFLDRFKTSKTWKTAKSVWDKALFDLVMAQIQSQFLINPGRHTLADPSTKSSGVFDFSFTISTKYV